MRFAPIAVVGRACLLPGANDPRALFHNVVQKRDAIGRAPNGRWRVDRDRIACAPTDAAAATRDHSWSDRGGYVDGFDAAFDPRGFSIDAGLVGALDPLFQWSLHTGREAIASAALSPSARTRTGVVLGNLSFPTTHLSARAERTWIDAQVSSLRDRLRPLVPDVGHPLDRFSSAMPAKLLARALDLGGEAFALDAACASSLYAIKLACDRLHDGRADAMIAGGINRTDDLFIHVGFCALHAMSKRGLSRPFHRDADGLVPAEGAAMVVLKRLDDAVAAGDRIFGVIRGVGLSNDGRGSGFLAPAAEGQLRAMRRAYDESGIRPRDVSLFECHATGTTVGDATEIESLTRLLRDDHAETTTPIGSLKSNLGHLITAAGAAGLLKVLGAFEAKVRPPTLHIDAPSPALDGAPLRLLGDAEPWPDDRPRIAAVSAFGFGGNNAHLIVEEWTGASHARSVAARSTPPKIAPKIAIVGVAVVAAGAADAASFARALADGTSQLRPLVDGTAAGLIDDVAIDPIAARFPPRDLQQALPQQLLMLRAATDAASEVKSLPSTTTSVLIGMGCDPEIARYGARWRVADWSKALGQDAAWTRAAEDAFAPALESAGVVGTMPNIPANRINSALDVAGPSFTVSSEETSGLVALDLAARALVHGEIDAAIVGAVDLSVESVHTHALAALRDREPIFAAGDAAVALVLKRVDDAKRDGDHVYALLGEATDDAAIQLDSSSNDRSLAPTFGHAHAASALLHVAAGALSIAHRLLPPLAREGRDEPAPWLPDLDARTASISLSGTSATRDATTATVHLRDDDAVTPKPLVRGVAPRVFVFAGDTRADVVRALDRDGHGGDGPARLTIVARDERELRARSEQARARLADPASRGVVAPGCTFHERPLVGAGVGELAFVFTGAASAYARMGRDLALAFPDAVARLARRFARIRTAAGWIYDAPPNAAVSPVDKLWGTSFLSQLHADILENVLGIRPSIAIGVSSGETNALFALGAFTDLDAMHDDVDASGLYTTALGGDFGSVRTAWGEPAGTPIRWENVRIVAPLECVRQAIAREPRAHVTIVNAADDCVIGGDVDACARVVAAIGEGRARSIGYDLAIHCAEVEAWRSEWRALHRRHITPVDGVRFYTHATGTHYALSSDAVADALTGQAVHEIDFPTLLRGAHRDGARVFLEIGPQSGCSRWVEQTLGASHPHAAIAMDYLGEPPIDRLVHAAAQLFAAGAPIDLAALHDRLTPTAARASRTSIRFPAHRPPPMLPALVVDEAERARDHERPTPMKTNGHADNGHATNGNRQRMLPAPKLPSVLGQVARVQAPVASVAPASDRYEAPIATAHATTSHPALVAILETQRRTAEVHRVFIAQQAELHQRFLQQRMVGGAAERVVAKAAPAAMPTFAPAFVPSVAPSVAPTVQAKVIAQAPSPQTSPPAPLPRAPRNVEAQERGAVAGPSSAVAKPLEKPVQPRALAPSSFIAATGPTFDRPQLETLASSRISEVFGPLFSRQDDFRRQVRMPMPPLLLADRVSGIDATPGETGKGTIWTETDLTWDCWYLSEGRIPAGVLIEAGQADLLLISWMGADFLNRGERVYRLLGCDLTYHLDPARGGVDGLPAPGQTLGFDIHVDGHAQHGDVRIFFFHYDCRAHRTLDQAPSDGLPVLTVRNGQAGFFTDEELAGSGGILWDAETGERADTPRLDAPVVSSIARTLSRAQVKALVDGSARACFGDSHALADTHVSTPRIGKERLDFLGEVTDLDVNGGPWKRGYLRAVTPVTPNDWFFEGHFKGDPCMPGTLMFEACMQAMALYMTALGHTLDRDGWRFEPVPEETYRLRCRGQVTPKAKELVYEIFVDEVIAGGDGALPTLFADILCSVDGLKAFHCRRMGLRLVPDVPMSRTGALSTKKIDATPVAIAKERDGSDFAFGYDSLLACAWGKPSRGFGRRFSTFDGPRRTPRLPGPPYHFMSRIAKVEPNADALFVVQAGASVEVEYDIPQDAWYFGLTESASGRGSMPYAVILEAALQPCGWLASATGVTLEEANDVAFRNLDGTCTWHRELRPALPGEAAAPLVTRTKLTSVSRASGMVIVSFEVRCFLRNDEVEGGQEPVFTMNTVFGFFPKEALASQAGLSTNDDDRKRLAMPSDVAISLRDEPARFFGGAPAMSGGMIRLLDRITGLWPDEGDADLGRIRAEKDIDASEWFFKAHFFQDPVQPGSLGIEAMIQAVQAYVLLRDLAHGIPNARFQPMAMAAPGEKIGTSTWKYRGQVLPKNKLVTTEAQITKVLRDERGVTVVADAWLWVDGMRIYQCKGLAIRVVAGDPSPTDKAPSDDPPERTPAEEDRAAELPSPAPIQPSLRAADLRAADLRAGDLRAGDSRAGTGPGVRSARDVKEAAEERPAPEDLLSPTTSPWLLDHRPTYTVPAVPFMSIVDRLATAARAAHPELKVARLRDVRVHRWLALSPSEGASSDDGGFAPLRLTTHVSPLTNGEVEVTLSAWRTAPRAELSRFEKVATGRVKLARAYESPIAHARVDAPTTAPNPYENGLFHGPAFQLVRALRVGARASVATIEVKLDAVPVGILAPVVLDAALHGIPHDRLHEWAPEIGQDVVGYPWWLEDLTIHGPTPTRGTVTATAQLDRVVSGSRDTRDALGPPRARLLVQLAHEGRVWADITLQEILLPKGPLGAASPAARRAFLQARTHVEGVSLSRFEWGETHLSDADVRASDWLPGTLNVAYALTKDEVTNDATKDATIAIAIREHLGHAAGVHPSTVTVAADRSAAWSTREPLSRHPIVATRNDDSVVVTNAGEPTLDLSSVKAYWSQALGVDRWLIGDLYFALIERFVRRFVVHAPRAFEGPARRGVIFLGNHQVGVESLLFSVMAASVVGGPVATLAKSEHQDTWIGELIALGNRYPGVTPPESIVFFDRRDEASLLDIATRLGDLLSSGTSIMVHVEGTRALSARHSIVKMASLWIDLATQTGAPIVPVRFVGGLPVEPLQARIDFPIGFGTQDHHIGAPIDAQKLAAMPLIARSRTVIDAIHALGVRPEDELPNGGDPAFADAVASATRRGMRGDRAVLLRALERTRTPSSDTARVLSALLEGRGIDGKDAHARWLAEAATWLRGAAEG